jgi:cysteine-rich repeat protein
MFSVFKKYLKAHKKVAMTTLVVALFATAALLIGRTVGLDGISGLLKGDLTSSSSIQVSMPRAGDKYKSVDKMMIQWTGPMAPTSFGQGNSPRVTYTITLSSPIGKQDVVTGYGPKPTNFVWVVPAGQAASDKYQITIRDSLGRSGTSKGPFSINMVSLPACTEKDVYTCVDSSTGCDANGNLSRVCTLIANPNCSNPQSVPKPALIRPCPFSGTVVVKQKIAGSSNITPGTVQLIYPNQYVQSIASQGFNANAVTGDYKLGTITPPVGYRLANVTDSSNKPITTPQYTQSLTRNGIVTYFVNYEPAIPVATGTLSVTNTSTNKILTVAPSGEIELLAFDAVAQNGPAKISKIIFDLSGYGNTPLSAFTFKLYRNGSPIKTWAQVPLFDFTGVEENIAAGSTNHYSLKGLFSTVPDQLIIALNSGLIAVQPITITGLPIQQALAKPVPQAICGNGIKEGAEACDDGNMVSEDGCSDKCAIDQVKPKEPLGDISIEGKDPLGEGTVQPKSKILVAGSLAQPVANYTFTATAEAYTVNKLTLINNNDKESYVPVDTNAIKTVLLKYTDKSGMMQTATGIMAEGKVTLTGLNFYVSPTNPSNLSVAVDVNGMMDVGESLSGKTFRIKIPKNNTADTFSATGETSGGILNTATLVGTDPSLFVVRKSVPTFAKTPGLTTSLINGDNRLYGIMITADNAGPIGLGRLTFWVQNQTSATLGGFKLYRNSTLISANDNAVGNATIHDGASLTDIAYLNGTGSVKPFSTSAVVVAFNQEETIGAGQSMTYYLDANVKDFDGNGSVTVAMHTGDEITPVANIVGFNACGGSGTSACSTDNGNTGAIYNAQVNRALFFKDSDFFTHAMTPVFQVWSDRSADMHLYPTVTLGTPNTLQSSSGSYDWTNGWLLQLDSVPSLNLSR